MTAPAAPADTRKQILEAALAALAAAGHAPARMDDVAARAGVSRATLYYHFHGREELISALIEQGLDDLADAIAEPAASGDPMAVLDTVIHFYANNEDRCRFLFTHLLAPERAATVMRRERDQVVAPLSACLAAQGREEPEVLAEALLGQVNGLVFGRMLREEPLDLDRAGPSLLRIAERVLDG